MMERYLEQSVAAGKRQNDLDFSSPRETWPYSAEQFELLNNFKLDDVRILEDETDDLIRLPDQALHIKHLGISYPPFFHHPGRGLILEALEQLGLPTDGEIRSSECMAVSAYESGMCRFGHVTGCHGGDYHDKGFLIVDYENATLSVSHVRVFLSQMLVWDDGFIDPELGGHAPLGLTASEGEEHWKIIEQRIATSIAVHEAARKELDPPLKQYIITGGLGHDHELHSAVRRAFWTSLKSDNVKELLRTYREDWNPIFIPAIGAATLTKDYKDAPKPLGCSEPSECGRVREEVH